jgi:hypothetical protein
MEVAPSPVHSLVRAFPLRVSAPPSNGLAAVPFALEGVAFFLPVPPMDAHGNREEQVRPCGGATLPVSPRLRSVSHFLFPLLCPISFRVRVSVGAVGSREESG